jgi:hypothetical protein
MVLLENDGTLIWAGAANMAGRSSGTIDLPVDLLELQSDLIDRIVAFAFDVLGLQTVELRVRPPQPEVRNPGAASASPHVVPMFDAV